MPVTLASWWSVMWQCLSLIPLFFPSVDQDPVESLKTPVRVPDAVLYERAVQCAATAYVPREQPRSYIDGVEYAPWDGEPLVHIYNALDEDDISNIGELVNCVQLHLSSTHLVRRGSRPGKDDDGASSVHFLTGFIQYSLPNLAARLQALAQGALLRASPIAGLPAFADPLTIRTVKVLAYFEGDELSWRTDAGSNATLVIGLSTRRYYEGGSLHIASNMLEPSAIQQLAQQGGLPASVVVDVERGGGVVFGSERPYSMSPVQSGERYLFVVEFWDGPVASMEQLRPARVTSAPNSVEYVASSQSQQPVPLAHYYHVRSLPDYLWHMLRLSYWSLWYEKKEAFQSFYDKEYWISAVECAREGDTVRHTPRWPQPSFGSQPNALFVRIHYALDDTDIAMLWRLSRCVMNWCPETNLEVKRTLEGDDLAEVGSNNVTFITGFLQYVLPELGTHLMDVALRALASAHLPSSGLYIRCAEMLEYMSGGLLEWHFDSGSVYTMIIWLADRRDFEGGQLQIASQNGNKSAFYYELECTRGSGVIFGSEAMHRITPVLSGYRYVLVVEFWTEFESVIGHQRPDEQEEYLYDIND